MKLNVFVITLLSTLSASVSASLAGDLNGNKNAELIKHKLILTPTTQCIGKPDQAELRNKLISTFKKDIKILCKSYGNINRRCTDIKGSKKTPKSA